MSAYVRTTLLEREKLVVDNQTAGLCDKPKVMQSSSSSASNDDEVSRDENPLNCKDYRDPSLPKDYVATFILKLDEKVYVAYSHANALIEPQHSKATGIISEFRKNGEFIKRLVSRVEQLQIPTGMAKAPRNFGAVSGMLLVANGSNGRVLAFDIDTGNFGGALFQEDVTPIIIDGVKSIAFEEQTLGTSKPSLRYVANVRGQNSPEIGRISLALNNN